MAFCTAMKNFEINEKGNITNSLEGSAKDCLGMVNLFYNGMGRRGGGKKGLKCDIDEKKINELVDFIFNNIEKLENMKKKKEYWGFFVKLIFHLRDHKEGNGERLLFYKLLLRLHEKMPRLVNSSLSLITGAYDANMDMDMDNDKPFGSFKDLNNIYDLCEEKHTSLKTSIVNYYIKCIIKDKYAVLPSLAVKWIPRENKTHDLLAKNIATTLFIDPEPLHKKMKKYRILIGGIMKKIVVIDKLMAEGRWDEIELKNIPSKALMKFLYAFKNEDKATGTIRHPDDEKRMILRQKILEGFEKSPEESKINIKGLQPYEITKEVINSDLTEEQKKDIVVMWNKFEYEWNKDMSDMKEGKDDLVIMSDVSYSMSGIAMEACIALSLLFANKLKKPWKNKVLTFDTEPAWFDIPEHMDIVQKIKHLLKAPWGGSTNIGLALDRMLDIAVKNKIKPEDMPSKLLILSDMQFDRACKPGDTFLTGYELIESKYKKSGLAMPHIIFWNLRGNTKGYVNKTNQAGTTMLSGFGASTFKKFMSGDFDINNTPWDTLKDILMSNRLSKLNKIIELYIN